MRDVVVAAPLGYRPILLDLDVPASTGPVPTVVLLYGGAFATGSHQHDGLGEYLTPRLLRAGLAVARVSYRHSREAPFPAQLHDVKAAVRWLRQHGPELGLDAGRFGTWGASSGGHLSVLLAVTGHDPGLEGSVGLTGPSSAVQAAISRNTPVNLARLPPPPPESPFFTIGIDPHDWRLGGSAAEQPDRARQSSTCTHVTASAAPLLVVHGELDTVVPIDQSEEIAAAYRRAGAAVQYVPVPGQGHFFDPVTREQQADAGIRFLQARLPPPVPAETWTGSGISHLSPPRYGDPREGGPP